MEQEKKPIVATLRAMKVGKKEVFPIEQYNSINTLMYRTLLPERCAGVRWSVKTDVEKSTVTVTRIS